MEISFWLFSLETNFPSFFRKFFKNFLIFLQINPWLFDLDWNSRILVPENNGVLTRASIRFWIRGDFRELEKTEIHSVQPDFGNHRFNLSARSFSIYRYF